MISGKQMIFNGSRLPMEMQSASIPELKDGEVLIRNLFTTICGSDLHTYCGMRKEACPTILGHEIVGKIEKIGPGHRGFDHKGNELKQDDLITWSIFSSDPKSFFSLNGMPQKGDRLFKYGHAQVTDTDVFHGGLSEFCILKPGTCILKVPESLPLPIAAIINCAIATVAGSLRMAGNLKNKNVVIFGMGMLGATCAAMCKEAGANWVGAADISEKRLQEVLAFGADESFLLTKNNSSFIKKIQDLFSPKGVDVVFDMSGSPEAMETGLDLLAVGGTAVWVGAVLNTRKLQVDAEKVIRRLLTIRGLHNYNYEDFVYALDFITCNWQKYPFEQAIEKEFSLDQANEAFEYALQRKPLRVGIRI